MDKFSRNTQQLCCLLRAVREPLREGAVLSNVSCIDVISRKDGMYQLANSCVCSRSKHDSSHFYPRVWRKDLLDGRVLVGAVIPSSRPPSKTGELYLYGPVRKPAYHKITHVATRGVSALPSIICASVISTASSANGPMPKGILRTVRCLKATEVLPFHSRSAIVASGATSRGEL